jgi:hypothetical protein
VNDKLAAKNGTVADWLSAKLADREIIDTAFLTCLSRPPTEAEAQGYLQILKDSGETEKRACVEDVMWSLLTSREFLFQH